jgi:23S rRNA (cytosine1962-C5)-methyltransferase
MNHITLITKPSNQYELLDSGRGEKLEKFGDITLARPDPQALWEQKLSYETWRSADGSYVREGGDGSLPAGRQGKWTGKLPKEWQIEFGGLQFLIKPTSFKHTGLFPEQLSNWEWAREVLATKTGASVLNLFAYTGGATLAAAQAGAEVTHVDSSKTAVLWARENAALSGLSDKPIRWITEDVLVFVKREIKRGAKYDAIVMDPPAFGHGPKNELWKIEENLLELIKLCRELLSDTPLFVLINGYAEGYSPLAFAYNLAGFKEKWGGDVDYGDVTIEEKNNGRLLPAGIFARWRA